MQTSHPATRLAFFTAFAVTIYIVESFIPKPFPFMRIGLANILILIILLSDGFKSALIVSFSKTIIGGFFTGTFLGPTTLLSLSGGIFSLIIMFIFIRSKVQFSIIGISILGATAHNFAQISIVRLILIKQNTIFYLTPLLVLMGIVTGIITGFIAKKIMERNEVFYEKRSN
ncbi:MAG: Gx transporter family protein [Candidatus Cloacimonetes bacterium]|nr:Gx transporter family protein [Candidatus Cloacimonadota bacterium]